MTRIPRKITSRRWIAMNQASRRNVLKASGLDPELASREWKFLPLQIRQKLLTKWTVPRELLNILTTVNPHRLSFPSLVNDAGSLWEWMGTGWVYNLSAPTGREPIVIEAER